MKISWQIKIFQFFLLLFFGIAAAVPARSQVVGHQIGDAAFDRIHGVIVDSLTQEPVAGALVTLINTNGSMHAMADKEGKFLISMIGGAGSVRLEVSMLGYRLFKKQYDSYTSDIDAGTIRLLEDPEELDASIVKGRKILFKQLGDTVAFFPSALLLGRPVSVLEALRFMPGVKADKDGVEVNGKRVARTYVNGKLVFGKDDPLAALNNIDAKDVAAILAYDEMDERSKVLSDNAGETRKVMNVVTFEQIEQTFVADASLSGGADTQENADGRIQGRYLGGAGLQYYSEQRQLNIKYEGNNIGKQEFMNRDNVYQRDHRFDLNYSQKIGKTWDVKASYRYMDSYSLDESRHLQEYFATADLPARAYSDSLSNSSRQNMHYATVGLSHTGAKSLLDAAVNASWTDRHADVFSGTLLSSENLPVSNTSIRDRRNDSGFNMDSHVSYALRTQVGSFSVNGTALLGRSCLDQRRQEDSTDRMQDKVILIEGNDRSHNLTGNFSYSKDIGSKGKLSASYSMNHVHEQDYHLVTDEMTGEMDPVLSRQFTDNFLVNSGSLSYFMNTAKWMVNAVVVYEHKGIRRDDQLVSVSWKKKNFQSIKPGISVTWRPDNRQYLMFSYKTGTNSPSLEMLSDRLDYRNPMYLTLGNPELKQGYDHRFQFQYNLTEAKSQLTFKMEGNVAFSQNFIGSRNFYFGESTFLPEYQYTAVKGSNLTTYANLDGKQSAYGSLSVNGLIPYINSTGVLSLSYSYDRQPMYIRDEQVSRYTHSPSMNLALWGNFSKQVNLHLQYRLAYRKSTAVGNQSYSSMNNYLYLILNTNFAKRMFVDMTYLFNHDYSFTHQEVMVSGQRLKIEAGCRLFKKQNAKISLSVNDLINRNKAFEQHVYADRVESTWKYKAPRFVMLNFTYTFKRSK